MNKSLVSNSKLKPKFMKKKYFKPFKLFQILLIIICVNPVTAVQIIKDNTTNKTQISNSKIYVSTNGNDKNDGTRENPLKSIHLAIVKLNAGQILILLPGTYNLEQSVKISKQGDKENWIIIEGEKNTDVIFDGLDYNIGNTETYPFNKGLIQIENAEYVRIKNITVKNSHRSGINIRESKNIDIINCTTINSLSPGIAAWQHCSYIRVLGNTVINASDMEMSWNPYRGSEAPHEAISMAGPHYFEVAYNHVYNCKKEGIDVKETASFGKVHHNYIHHCARQGLYIDGWFGQLQNIEMYENVVHNCEAGIAVSSEEGPNTKNLKIHHNLIYNNRATGLFFSRWGADNPRENVEVYNNTFYKNGWGHNFSGDPQYWLTGGCYLYSVNLKDVKIRNNIFAQNSPFEIGRTSLLSPEMMKTQKIEIDYNLVHDINTTRFPVYLETWLKDTVYSIKGENTILASPLFEDPESGDFRLKKPSPAVDSGHPDPIYNDKDNSRNDVGAFPLGTSLKDFWWLNSFPPKITKEYLIDF